MSEYGFEYGDDPDGENAGDLREQAAPPGAEPKWFRERMDKVSEQMKTLTDENERLKSAQRQAEIAEQLKAKGYQPEAAKLFQGEPNKLDEWLTDHGSVLAKLPSAEGQSGEGEQQPPEGSQGPPASTVPADGQQQMQRMQEAGATGTAPPQGSDKELAAALAACQTEEDFAKLMKSHGNKYDWR